MKRLSALVSLFLIFGVSVFAQSGPFNYAQYWHNIPEIARVTYAEGLEDGVSRAHMFILKKDALGADKLEELRKHTAPMFEPKVIISVMGDLYKDPANCFIRTEDMYYISRDKLLGNDVEKLIADARQYAVENYELNKRMKK